MRYLKLYGERHTSTNYLSRVIALNLDVEELIGIAPRWLNRLDHILRTGHRLRDRYFERQFASTLGWKHMRVQPERLSRLPLVENDEVALVTLTKNPYAWLLSLHRNPYHQAAAPGELETFLQTPLTPLGREGLTAPLDPVSLWNEKNRAYLELADHGAFNLTSEALLASPEQAITTIAERFSLPRRGPFVNFEHSTKKRPGQDGDFYRDYYLNERWRERLSAQAIDIINANLDPEVVNAYDYELIS